MSDASTVAARHPRVHFMRAVCLALSFGLACSVALVACLIADDLLHPSFGRSAFQFAAHEILRVTAAAGVLGLIFASGVASSALIVRRLHAPGITWTILGGASCGLSGGWSLCSAQGWLLLAVVLPFLVGVIVGYASSAAAARSGRW